MTDHEVLEKYRETIKEGVHKFCQKNHIEDIILKERILKNYQEGFLEGFKEGEQIGIAKGKERLKNAARRMLSKGMSIEEVGELIGISANDIKSLQ